MSQYAQLTTDINTARRFLTEGRIVVFPTGTSYGLAADVLQGHALQRLRNIKGRPANKTFTIFMADELWGRFLYLTAREEQLLRKLFGQALTVLVKPRENIQHLAGDNGLVGLRLIDHPLMEKLAENYSAPLTATSANYAGGQPCFSPECVLNAFPGKLPDDRLGEEDPRGASGTTYDLSLACVLDGGTLPEHPPTTIARLKDAGGFEIIRQGALAKEDMIRVITSSLGDK